jgi:hypothetical protein
VALFRKLGCPILKDKRNVEMPFKEEQPETEGNFILPLSMYFLMFRNGTGASQKLHICFYK